MSAPTRILNGIAALPWAVQMAGEHAQAVAAGGYLARIAANLGQPGVVPVPTTITYTAPSTVSFTPL